MVLVISGGQPIKLTGIKSYVAWGGGPIALAGYQLRGWQALIDKEAVLKTWAEHVFSDLWPVPYQ